MVVSYAADCRVPCNNMAGFSGKINGSPQREMNRLFIH